MPVATAPAQAPMKEPIGHLPASEAVHCVQFCPFEWSAGLVAFGGKRSIVVGQVKLQEEGESRKPLEFTRLSEFHHDGRVEVIAWSPESSLHTFPQVVKFAVASGDKRLKLIHSDLADLNTCDYLEGHTDYINAVIFLENGHQIASTGDDHTALVWTLNPKSGATASGDIDADGVAARAKLAAAFPLGSPGVALGWHPDESAKLMVAEKAGVIRFYNISNQQTILSLDTPSTGGLLNRLSHADLCPGNPLIVAGLVSASGHRLVWDVSRSSQALESTPAHQEGGGPCAFSPAKPDLLASVSRTGGQLRVFNVRTNQTVFAASCPASHGLSWHARQALVAVGSDKKVILWRIDH